MGLVIERSSSISLDKWRQVVAQDPELRIRDEPYLAVNPKTGQKLSIAVGDADSELSVGEEWEPFLRFDGGKLKFEYAMEYENPNNPVRQKIVELASLLGATIATDAGDALRWSVCRTGE